MLVASVRSLLQQPLQLFLLLLGMALGVAIVAAVQLSTASARHSYQAAITQLDSGATHQLRALAGIPSQLYVQLQRAPQSWSVLPVVRLEPQFVVTSSQGDSPALKLQLYGLDLLIEQRLRPGIFSGMVEGQLDWSVLMLQPSIWLSKQVATKQGLTIGDSFILHTPSGCHSVTLVGIFDDSQRPELAQRALMDIGQALMLKRETQLSYLDMMLTETQAEVLQSWLIEYGWAERVNLVQLEQHNPQPLGDAFYFNLNAMALLALLMGSLVVYSVIALSLQQRQPLFATLRLAGVSAAGLISGLLLELLLLSSLATLAGIALGMMLAHGLMPLLVESQAAFSVAPVARLHLSGGDLLRLWLLGSGGALLAALWPCLQLARCSPLQLQQPVMDTLQPERQVSRWRLMLVVMLLLAAGLLQQQQNLWALYSVIAALTLICALLLAPLLRMLALGLSQLLRRRPLALMVVRDGLRQQHYSQGMMLVLLLSLSSSIAISGMTSSFHQAFHSWLQQRLDAAIYISPADNHSGGTRHLDDKTLQALQARLLSSPEVKAYDLRWRQSLWLQGREVSLYSANFPQAATDSYQFIDQLAKVDSKTLWQQLRAGEGVMISEPLAWHLKLKAGDQLQLGPALSRPVLAIYSDYGSYQGRMLVGRSDFQRLFQAVPPYGVRVWLWPGVDAQSLITEPGWQDSRWQLRLAGLILQRSDQLFEQTFLITDALQLLFLLVALLAMGTNLLALQHHRRTESQRYRALGMSPALRRLIVLGQALLLAFSAGLLSLILGELLALLLTEQVQKVAFGWSIPWQYDGWRSLIALLSGMVAALLAAWLAATVGGKS